jgi:hypothetical protein
MSPAYWALKVFDASCATFSFHRLGSNNELLLAGLVDFGISECHHVRFCKGYGILGLPARLCPHLRTGHMLQCIAWMWPLGLYFPVPVLVMHF